MTFVVKSVHLSKNYLTNSLSTWICILHLPGPGEPGKRSPFSCNTSRHCLISLASSWQYASRLLPGGTFHLVLNFSTTLFHSLGLVGQHKYSSADLGDEFADGASANQPVVLQAGAGLSCCQVSQCYCQF